MGIRSQRLPQMYSSLTVSSDFHQQKVHPIVLLIYMLVNSGCQPDQNKSCLKMDKAYFRVCLRKCLTCDMVNRMEKTCINVHSSAHWTGSWADHEVRLKGSSHMSDLHLLIFCCYLPEHQSAAFEWKTALVTLRGFCPRLKLHHWSLLSEVSIFFI